MGVTARAAVQPYEAEGLSAAPTVPRGAGILPAAFWATEARPLPARTGCTGAGPDSDENRGAGIMVIDNLSCLHGRDLLCCTHRDRLEAMGHGLAS